MFGDRLDTVRLRADIEGGSAECVALKRLLRTTWTRPMADEQRRLCRMGRRVTELLVLRARLRGRMHVCAQPRDLRQAATPWDPEAWHARIADRVALDYALPTEPEVRT